MKGKGLTETRANDIAMGWLWYGNHDIAVGFNMLDLKEHKAPRIRLNYKDVTIEKTFRISDPDDIFSVIEAFWNPPMALICLAWDWTAPLVEAIVQDQNRKEPVV